MTSKFKYIALAALAAQCAVLSCTVEPLEQTTSPSLTTELTITATMEEDDVMTKTGVVASETGKKSVVWSAGDAISLFFNTGDNGGSKFTTQDSGTKATFSGSISSISGDLSELGSTAFFWGLYPYNSDASCNGSSIATSLRTDQLGIPDTFADSTAVTVGRSQNLALSFKNTNTIFAFKVAHDNIHRVKLYGNNGEKLSGKYSISFDNNGKVVSTPSDDAETYVSVTPAEGSFFVPDTWYYIVTLPVVFTQGYSMDFETWNDIATYTTTDTKTFKISTFYTLTNKDSGLEFVTNTGNVYIPDPEFKAYCVNNFDTNNDGEISYSEAKGVESIYVSSKAIHSLEGIHAFTGLTNLMCQSSSITSLDLCNNTTLSYLGCYYNQITDLNVSNNKALTCLDCFDNKISNLNVSNNTALTSLACGNNQISALEVNNATALKSLYCGGNKISSLDLSNNAALLELSCSNNQIASLDVSNNTALTFLDCGNNQISSLNVSNNTVLKYLACGLNKISNLNVSNNAALATLICYVNQISNLDISNNSALSHLDCNNNPISQIDVSKNTALTTLYCYNDQISTLNVSKNTALTSLWCSNNKISQLDVSDNTDLKLLKCYGNQISVLDITDHYVLKELYLSPMESLDELKVTNGMSVKGVYNSTQARSTDYIPDNTKITVIGDEPANIKFDCESFKQYMLSHYPAVDGNGDGEINEIEAYNLTRISAGSSVSWTVPIDLSYFKNLQDITFNSAVSHINAANLNKLERLYITRQGLESISVSGDINLNKIYLRSDKLSSLDVSGLSNLKELTCSGSCNALENNRGYDPQGTLSTLNIDGCTSLEYINVSANKSLSSIDLSAKTELKKITAYWCNLSSIDLTKNEKLTHAYLTGNPITSLDLSHNPDLEWLAVLNTGIENLDITHNTKLKTLYSSSPITGDGSSLTFLQVNLHNSDIDSYTVPFTNLKTLEFWSTEGEVFDNLDISACSCLESFWTSWRSIKSITFGAAAASLKTMAIHNMSEGLTIDFTPFSSLETLDCSGGTFSTLDVSALTNLKSLNCKDSPNLSEIWLKTGQVIPDFTHDSTLVIKYKD